MAEWLPLAAVEPFASTTRAERRSARLRILRRIAAGLLIIVALAAVAGIGYRWWTESAMVARAEQLIAAERYEEASTLLEPLAKQSYFVRRHAGYLLALGLARQFASASNVENAGDDLLDDARKQFGELFATSPNWREQAKSDLAGIMGAVPSHVPGSLERCVRLAEFLLAMQLADRKQLANELLGKAKSIWADPKCEPKQSDGEAVAWIVNGDAALLDDVVAAIVSDESGVEANLDQKLTCILHCVRGQPALAPLFGSSLAKRADQLAATTALETRHRLITTVKRIDSRFDSWAYWETYFYTAKSENLRDALQILTYMVEGEQTAERLKKATDLYCDLRKRHPGGEPPPEIRDVIGKADFDKLIAEANQLVKNRQYQAARTKLDEARRFSSSLWHRNADADRLEEDVRFHLDCEMARQSFGNGDLADALTNVQDALQVRPEDKEAADLRDKIQTEVDKAEVEQYRRKAESAIIAEDLRGAVDEIVKAHEILKIPANATWGAVKRGVLDQLAKTLIGKLHEQATALSDKRQYGKAEAAVTLGQRLSPRDGQLSELLVKIEALKSDPKSANISGKWVCQANGNVLEMTLTDSGANDVAWSLNGGGQQGSGSFTRAGTGLEGTGPSQMQGVPGQLTVKAKIESPDTIMVQSRVFTPNNKKLRPQRDPMKYTWTRQAAEETATPEDADEPSVRPPDSRPTPQRPRRT